MIHLELGKPSAISYDKDHESIVYVLCPLSDADAVGELYRTLRFSFRGVASLPHKKASVFAQRLLTPDRDEHFVCLTLMAGMGEALMGPEQTVLAFTTPLSLYEDHDHRQLFLDYVDLSTAFFTADNRSAHKIVDQAEALFAQIRS
jgi:hypothetical protein